MVTKIQFNVLFTIMRRKVNLGISALKPRFYIAALGVRTFGLSYLFLGEFFGSVQLEFSFQSKWEKIVIDICLQEG